MNRLSITLDIRDLLTKFADGVGLQACFAADTKLSIKSSCGIVRWDRAAVFLESTKGLSEMSADLNWQNQRRLVNSKSDTASARGTANRN